MKPSADIRDRLTHIGTLADSEVGPAETALLLASVERPRVAIEPYFRHLDRLCAEVHAYADADFGKAGFDSDLDLRVEAIHQVIVKRYGYGGDADAYQDPENTDLMRVIDRRRGLSESLGIIYLHVARALGWTAAGLAFPPLLLVRLEIDDRRVILDPFNGGRVLDARDMRELLKAISGNQAELTPDDYREMGNREILFRLQNHAKGHLLRAERKEDALDVLEAMLLFAPREPRLWCELGFLNARLDKTQAAVEALEHYLSLNPTDGSRYRTSVLIRELRARLG